MGYSTAFDGKFALDRKLEDGHRAALDNFAAERHSVDGGMPSYYCQWVPNEDGTAIQWDGGEKFRGYMEWLEYIIGAFLIPWGYTLNGEVHWSGDEVRDVGKIIVVDNLVTKKEER